MEPEKRDVTFVDLMETMRLMREEPIRTGPRKFYAAGSGFTDEFVVDYWNGSGIIVVTRDGKEWLDGIPVSEYLKVDRCRDKSSSQFAIYKALCEYQIASGRLRLDHKLRRYRGPSDDVMKKVVALCRKL